MSNFAESSPRFTVGRIRVSFLWWGFCHSYEKDASGSHLKPSDNFLVNLKTASKLKSFSSYIAANCLMHTHDLSVAIACYVHGQ